MEKNYYKNERADFYKIFSEFSKIEHELVTMPLIHVLENNLDGLDNRFGLDYGCGNGWVTSLVNQRGATIIGVDNSIDQIEKARPREKEGIKFFHIKNNDIGCIENSSLDFCFFRFSTCEMSDRIMDMVFKGVYKKLRTGGILTIGDQNREECRGHETMDVCYPYNDKLSEGEATVSILKKHGIRFIGNKSTLTENIDFIPIIDHFRSKSYMKYFLEKNGFSNIIYKETRLDKDSQIACFDEKNIAMYKITTAWK